MGRSIYHTFVFNLTVVALVVVAGQAFADHACGPTTRVHERLESLYGEQPYRVGLDSNGEVWEFWAAPDGTTWTILKTRPDGTSCIEVSGQHNAPVFLPPEGDPA